ncbi:hypothetical protein, partial [Amycolatopsis sacchari]|uniref:hypothetical protein n=1 Tax=Amycolatopsis sacchari TaxID=115433 RepID=UPI003D7259CC
MPDDEQDHFPGLSLDLLRPYLSITILVCCSEDPGAAFESLRKFLRRSAGERRQALGVRITREIDLRDQVAIGAFGIDEDWGIDAVFGLFREVRRSPRWAVKEAGLVDRVNQVTLALRRNNLVALWTEITTHPQLDRWIQRGAAPYHFLPSEVLAGTFDGDGKMIWTRGIHRRRASKADTKVLGGIRIQEALDGNEDGTYVWTAAKVDYQPEDDAAVLRNNLTISPERSRISWKRTSDLSLFLAATTEALDMLDKALVAEEPPDPLFPVLPT